MDQTGRGPGCPRGRRTYSSAFFLQSRCGRLREKIPVGQPIEQGRRHQYGQHQADRPDSRVIVRGIPPFGFACLPRGVWRMSSFIAVSCPRQVLFYRESFATGQKRYPASAWAKIDRFALRINYHKSAQGFNSPSFLLRRDFNFHVDLWLYAPKNPKVIGCRPVLGQGTCAANEISIKRPRRGRFFFDFDQDAAGGGKAAIWGIRMLREQGMLPLGYFFSRSGSLIFFRERKMDLHGSAS